MNRKVVAAVVGIVVVLAALMILFVAPALSHALAGTAVAGATLVGSFLGGAGTGPILGSSR